MQTHPTHYPTDLTDEEWDRINSLVPAPKSGKGKRGRPLKLDRRSLLNAIFYVVRSGCAWWLLPSDPDSPAGVFGSSVVLNAADLERKLDLFQEYYNALRVHQGLDGDTSGEKAGRPKLQHASLERYAWQRHCHGLFELPIAA